MTERLWYVLRFHRPAYGEGEPEPATTAQGLSITTQIEDGTVRSKLEPLEGQDAQLSLQFATNKDSSLFFEWGTLSFGDPAGSSLEFSGLGVGSLLAAAPDGFSPGSIAYRVESGSGALEGASGIIDSNFLVNLRTNELFDTHLGIIRLP